MKKGFTLVELLITIGVMAVLMAGTVSLIGSGSGETARDTRRRTDLGAVASALGMYRNDEGHYPSCNGSATCEMKEANLDSSGSQVTDFESVYIETIPTDPKSADGRIYLYKPMSSAGGTCDNSTTARCARFVLCAGWEKDETTDNTGVCGAVCGSDVCVFTERNP